MGRRCYVLLRHCHDVPIRCRRDVPLRRLCEVPPRGRWVFHLRRTCDVAGTYRERSLQRRYDVLFLGGTELQEEGEGISVTTHYHFHPLHRHLDIRWVIAAER